MTDTLDSMPTKGRPQVAIRMAPEEIEELEAIVELAAKVTPLGGMSRSDVVRRAITAGLPRVRREVEAMVSSLEDLDA